jgi:hypothetical protein
MTAVDEEPQILLEWIGAPTYSISLASSDYSTLLSSAEDCWISEMIIDYLVSRSTCTDTILQISSQVCNHRRISAFEPRSDVQPWWLPLGHDILGSRCVEFCTGGDFEIEIGVRWIVDSDYPGRVIFVSQH